MMRLKKVKFLGAGSYASVHLAQNQNSVWTSFTAVKSTYLSSSVVVSSLLREKKFLDELVGCPYIIQCFGDDLSIEQGQQVYNIMMEYAPGGTLKALMKEKKGGRVQESEVACYAAMLLGGLSIAHSKGIVHCDLKPDNILVFPMKEEDGVLNHVLKIADFGLAKKVWEKDLVGSGKKSFNRGALLYASPEAVAFGVHFPATDVWSLGCIILEMLSGLPIWGCCRSSTELIGKVAFMEPEIPEYVSDIGRDFLTRCLEKDPSKRWTTEMLLKHTFIKDSLRQFRGIEHMICNMNPFGSAARPGIRRRDTFSDLVRVFPYPGLQPSLRYPATFQQSNTIKESRRPLIV